MRKSTPGVCIEDREDEDASIILTRWGTGWFAIQAANDEAIIRVEFDADKAKMILDFLQKELS